jgi:hypothetical protein
MMNLLEHQSYSVGDASYRVASFFTPFDWTISGQLKGSAGGGRRRVLLASLLQPPARPEL